MNYGKILSALLMFTVLLGCKDNVLKITQVESLSHPIDSTIVEDTTIDEFIKPYRLHLNKTLDSVLCYAPKNFVKSDGELESSLGNLMADIALEQAQPYFEKRNQKKIDFVLLNKGGMRAPILKGGVTARNAFELMPFENELVVVALNYMQIKEMLKYLFQAKSAHPVANIRLQLDKKKKSVVEVNVGGKELDSSKTYLVLTTDYLQQGGDNMKFFSNPVALYKTDYKLRNALIDYFKKVDTLKVELDNRMRYAE
ncbi:5'-nucleotidase [Aquimarina brevivitae]|uniref:5'-nucleotidase n=2 Tax=Aquimarina brevivitae TaxID=323412 RepID=A0A4Q7PGQ3_9FLAO|nr:5'-nucleotidase [Aquimarina brevivitae]